MTDPRPDVLGALVVPMWDRFDEANRAVLRPHLANIVDQLDAARPANVTPGTDSLLQSRRARDLARALGDAVEDDDTPSWMPLLQRVGRLRRTVAELRSRLTDAYPGETDTEGGHTLAHAASELDDAHSRVDAARDNVINGCVADDLGRALAEIEVGLATLQGHRCGADLPEPDGVDDPNAGTWWEVGPLPDDLDNETWTVSRRGARVFLDGNLIPARDMGLALLAAVAWAPALAPAPLTVGEVVTGDRAVSAPLGTKLGAKSAAVAAVHTTGGWSVTGMNGEQDHAGAVRINEWVVLSLPEVAA